MSGSAKKLLHAAAGSASGDPVYVEDVFNTTLFIGDSADNRDIVTGLDMSGEGGMCWFKTRSHANSHEIYDTARGVNKVLFSDVDNAETTQTSSLTAFNSDGFEVSSNISVNVINRESVAWSFRKQTGFFDVVTYTGNGSGDQTISHNLGSTPGFIAVKALNAASSWRVFHTGTGNTKFGYLNSDSDIGTIADLNWNVTSTTFVADSQISLNTNARTYVAYLWASGTDSDSQIFGEDGDEAIIKCGSYTADSSNAYAVNLGFEPQWLMIKRTDTTGDWEMLDNMRGVTYEASEGQFVEANKDPVEFNDYGAYITSTGFVGSNQSGSNGASYVYIAIRRGPMKEPSAGTDVYIQDESHPTAYEAPFFQTPWPVDLGIYRKTTSTDGNYLSGRILGRKYLVAQSNAQGNNDNANKYDFMNGYYDLGSGAYADYPSIMFRRYPKVFDISVVTSSTSSAANYSHNLGVAPEFFIAKRLDGAGGWVLDQVNYYLLMSNSADLGSQYIVFENLTATTFGAKAGTFSNGETHLVLMFASLDGISKVGTYTGTGNDLNVTGLNAAARFVLIKRTDSSGDWYVFDSTVQGIVSGNDPYWLLNVNASDVTNTDYIDPHSSGFTITSSAPAELNASGGTYRYLAIS